MNKLIVLKSNLIISSIQRILKFLPASYRLASLKQLFLMFLNSVIDVLGLAAIIPIMAAILKDGFIQNQKTLSYLFNFFGFESERSFIFAICIGVIFLTIIKNMLSVWIATIQTKFSWGINVYLSSKMFLSSFLKGLNYFNNQNSNEIQNRIVRIPQLISHVIQNGLIQFINELVILIIILTSITIYEPKVILLLSITIIPVFTLYYIKNNKQIKLLQKEINELHPQMIKPVYELSFGYVDVAISGVYPSFEKQFYTKLEQMKVKQIKSNILNIIPTRIIEITVIITIVLILVYGLFFFDSKESIISLIGIFGLAAYKAVPSLNRVMLAIITVKSFQYAIDEIENELDLNLDDQYSLNKEKGLDFKKSITIKNLSYKFLNADNYLLKDINFEIKKGNITGIVGRSGSGKTTLMNILLGFLEPTNGQIYIDDVELNHQTKFNWHKNIGYVRQDVFLIDGSVADNIAYGVEKCNIDHNRLNEVAKIACLEEFINSLENGMDSSVGERGTKISGGQKQRIGIARALYHGAEVLFFDEATSALDEKTENEITDSIRNLSAHNLTVLIIAHRLNTLKYCDEVYKVADSNLTLQPLNN